MGDEGYAYENIIKAYRTALEKASDRIGLDSHKKTLSSQSLDSKIINEEISKIHIAGRNFAQDAIVANAVLRSTDAFNEVKRYAESMERPPAINRYYNDENPCDDPNTTDLHADTVLSDLFNAFRHGIFQKYNFLVKGDSNALYEIYGDRKVRINFRIPEL